MDSGKGDVIAERKAKAAAKKAAKAAAKNKDGKQEKTASKDQTNNDSKTNKQKVTQSKSSVEEVQKKVDNLKITQVDEIKHKQDQNPKSCTKSIHPSFKQLSFYCQEKVILGPDSLCFAAISAFKQFIHDYSPPIDRVFSRELEVALRPQLSFLSGNRPLPLALGNLVKLLKYQITELNIDNQNVKECKVKLFEWLEFQVEKMTLAHQAIANFTTDKFKGKTVVLVYSWDPVVHKILMDLHEKEADFRVILLDSLPNRHGFLLLRSLIAAGIHCTYSLINSVSYFIQECTHVLFGADALMANGNILGECGMAQISLVAKSHNVPVLVACPTYKFTEKVQLSSERFEQENCTILSEQNLEVIPAQLISGIVTELRFLPPSSAAAVFRLKLTT